MEGLGARLLRGAVPRRGRGRACSSVSARASASPAGFGAKGRAGGAAAAVGVDLGTTNSCAAVFGAEEGGARVVAGPLPSVVHFAPGGAVVVGEAARAAAVRDARNVVASAKRVMGAPPAGRGGEGEAPSGIVGGFLALAAKALGGRDGAGARAEEDAWEGLLSPLDCPAAGRRLDAEAVAAEVLSTLKADAERALGRPVDRAVLAVPTRFGAEARDATERAAKAVGLEVLRIMHEPTAAALAYGFGRGLHGDERDDAIVLVFDLGGGTLDVSVLEVGNGVFEVLASCGDTHLGGDDVDLRVARWLGERWAAAAPGGATLEELASDASFVRALVDASEAAKIRLSDAPSTTVSAGPLSVRVPLGEEGGARDVALPALEAELTREELEGLCPDLFARMREPLVRVLAEAETAQGVPVDVGMLDGVLLVGGATRMPAVEALVAEVTGQRPQSGIDPDKVVAIGASIQAGALTGAVPRQEVIMLDEFPDISDVQALLDKTESLQRGATPT